MRLEDQETVANGLILLTCLLVLCGIAWAGPAPGCSRRWRLW